MLFKQKKKRFFQKVNAIANVGYSHIYSYCVGKTHTKKREKKNREAKFNFITHKWTGEVFGTLSKLWEIIAVEVCEASVTSIKIHLW